MKKVILLLSFLFIVNFAYADIVGEALEIREEDGSPSIVPYQLKVSNDTLTDNGDGTGSLNTSGSGSVSNTAYGASWDSVTTIAPSKNAVYDKIETISNASGWTDDGTIVRLTTSTDSVGIGNTAPQGLLDAGTTPGTGLIVTTASKVGIGTTNPSQKLDVSGTINATTITGANVTSGADPGHTHGSGSITEADPLAILTAGTRGLSGNWYNPAYNIGTLGNVGIGNTNPLVLLDTTTSPGAGLKVLASGRVGIGTTVPAYALDVSGDIRATGDIYSADQYTVSGDMGALGNLGVGTTTPSLKVDVRGAGTSVFGFVGGSMGIGNTAPQGLLDVSATTPGTGLIVLSTGRVGIGLTNPSVALDVSGTVNATALTEGGNAVFNTTEVPGGELGGSWGTPTVDSTHSGSAHHSAVTLGAGNDSSLALSGQELTLTVAKDLVTTSPLTGGTDNILTGADADITIALTQLKDIVTTTPLTGGENDVLPGGDADLTLAITIAKDIVAGVGLSGGEDNVLPGADADTTLTFDATELTNLTWSAGGSALLTHTFNLSGTDPIMTFGSNYVAVSTGNLGIGNTAPQALLDVGTSPGVGLIVLGGGNVGIGTTNPGFKLDIVGALRTDDTVPIMRLNIKNIDNTFNKAGGIYSTQKNMTITRMETICPTVASGTSAIFTLKTVGTDGTGPLTNLSVGQTSTLTNLVVTSFTGGTLPAGYGLIIDDISQVGGTPSLYRLVIFGHES